MLWEAINFTIFRLIRDIYVRRDTKIFSSVQQFADIINEQIGIRASLICGKLPAEEVIILRGLPWSKLENIYILPLGS